MERDLRFATILLKQDGECARCSVQGGSRHTVKTEILFGIHSVHEAIRARRRVIYELFLLKARSFKRLQGLVDLAESLKIPIRWWDSDAFGSALHTDRHQGVAARVSPFPLSDLSQLLAGLRPDTASTLLLLDNMVDPHNLGALIRTALCAGVEGICVPKDRSVMPTPAVSRVSAGALEHAQIALVTNMAKTLDTLKTRGMWMVGLDRSATDSIFAADLSGKVALVIGGEAKGIRPLVLRQCDMRVSIPQSGTIDSLNASAAGAVAMYEIYRQRSRKKYTNGEMG